jgi:hypothetical protein
MDPTFTINVNDLVVSGSLAYLATDNAGGLTGLGILDAVDPPTSVEDEVGFANGFRSFGVAVAGAYAYLAGYERDLQIVDITDPRSPGSPIQITTGTTQGIAVAGNYAYVATIDESGGLGIVKLWNQL